MTRASEKPCSHCGEVFKRDPRNTWAYWGRAKYCSQSCAGAARKLELAAKRPSIEQSFNRHVVKQDGCWGWTGSKDKDGYAVFFHARKQYRAAAFSLMLDGRPASNGLYACHNCDNPECVRPDHLYPGTPKQNVADMVSRGRAKFGFARRAS